MKIYIEDVKDTEITFLTKHGTGKAIWKSNHIPTIGEYIVEFDIIDVYNYSDFNISDKREFYVGICEKGTVLTLLLMEYEESGCATFRMGDSIIEMETNYDIRFKALEGTYVSVYVKQLEIYENEI